jgi:putative ABC transport system ATP-binding protein
MPQYDSALRCNTWKPLLNPAILLADEATGSLDTKRAHEVVSLIAHEVRTRRKAAIMVTHDERLLAYCDKVNRMEDGKLSLAEPASAQSHS